MHPSGREHHCPGGQRPPRPWQCPRSPVRPTAGRCYVAAMTPPKSREHLTYAACCVGLLVPLLYFGVQLAALPFAAGYSVWTQTASELGMTTVSTAPQVFNVGTMLRGALMLVAAAGFRGALKRMKARPFVTWLTTLSMVCIALNDLGAGLFPLPDARHEGVFLLGYVFWPPALLAALWRLPGARAFRTYLLLSVALSYGLLAARGVFGDAFMPAGLFQRVFALVTVVPIGAAAWFVARAFKQAREPGPSLQPQP